MYVKEVSSLVQLLYLLHMHLYDLYSVKEVSSLVQLLYLLCMCLYGLYGVKEVSFQDRNMGRTIPNIREHI